MLVSITGVVLVPLLAEVVPVDGMAPTGIPPGSPPGISPISGGPPTAPPFVLEVDDIFEELVLPLLLWVSASTSCMERDMLSMVLI